ncbi:anthranilate phosphoribosyltransferase [Sulfurimonas marina]|uniref:Anthranilate phosphoribosyltransferase n=1 Tax=Sulfurimonas marina TaxID=2590551 RepID=A0A7M1AVC1_9BACT|nr:anthranilate phosphoribosyltransferase [Sulfurimonas marina]QOP41370.1 anthranilate phosphoribosyltransferase [Sulfurimonas marina]
MTYEEAKIKFTQLFEHQMDDAQMKEFLESMALDATTPVDEIAAATEVMRAHAVKLPVSEEIRNRAIDIVGTGGDKIGSFNISSTTSILTAACGGMVAKHGNRSITSKSGSADVLEALGVNLSLGIEQNARLLEEAGWCFMFAQNHHPAMKFIMPIRKSIDHKTIFNVLGPLTNPADIKKYMLGVFDKSFTTKMAEALKMNGATSALVVSSKEGMDEIGISDITYATRLENGMIKEFEIDPQNYGLEVAPLEAIKGGDAKENAKIMLDIFNNNATTAQRDIVLLNTAASLMVEGLARDIQDGLEMAREALANARAKKKLKQIVEISNKL